MKRAYAKSWDDANEWPEDVARIVRVLAAADIAISDDQAELAWRDRSEAWAAGWLILDSKSDAVLVEELRPFLTIIDEEAPDASPCGVCGGKGYVETYVSGQGTVRGDCPTLECHLAAEKETDR